MNTWKNIKKEKPPINKGVLATDGSTVFFGRFMFTDGDLFFEGVFVETGEEFTCFAHDLTEWQFSTFAPEKTADEMFFELKYQKTKDDFNGVTYKEEKGVSVIRYGKERNIFSCSMYNQYYGFTPEEMAACVQLAKERGAL